MSVKARALHGIGWTALASWVQLSLNVVTFFVVTQYLHAVDFGVFGATLIVIGAVETVLGPTLTQSLMQRATLDRDHIDATFALAAGLAVLFAAAIVLAAAPLAGFVGAAADAPVLRCMALALPITALAGIPTALLARDLRFGAISRIEVVAGLLGSLVAISLALLGGGVWALVLADLTHRSTRAIGAFAAAAFRPAWPRRPSSLRDLASFNRATLGLAVLAYLDWGLPRLLTSRMLGTVELGYFAFARRVFEIITDVFLAPIDKVVMTSIARLHGDPAGVRAVINSIYFMSSSIGYPAFLGAILLAPDFVALQGTQWLPALHAMQIMLLAGLRTTTGTFNAGILRGTGRTGGPVLILAVAVIIQAILVPIAAQYSITWVAAAVLVRTLATWPIGCWLIERATGLSISQQLRTGAVGLVAALIMSAVVEVALAVWLLGAAPTLRIALGVSVGAATYAAAFLALSPRERQTIRSAWRALRSGGRTKLLEDLRARYGQAE